MKSLFALVFLAGSGWAGPADELTQRLATLNTLEAEFTQLARDAAGRDIQSIPGTLALARPNLMRWETQDPIPQLIVSDGDSLWTYDKDLEQVTRDPVSVLADSPAALLLNLNDQDLAQQYFVEELQRAGDKVVYQLTPNDDSLYQALVLEFLGDLPLSVGVIDTLDQQTRITLRNVRLNQPATAVFEFTLPPGVDLLDNREP